MTSQIALELAAQAWCKKETEQIELNDALANAFAEVVDEVIHNPCLENAKTEDLVAELGRRAGGVE